MRNRVEILRAIQFTKKDIEDNLNRLEDIAEFTEKDFEFMEEFKKIYEMGLEQLQTFIDKLDSEGSELDEYTIKYYVNVLLNGPLGAYVREFSKDKNYFIKTPDVMGVNGNLFRSKNNTSDIKGQYVSLGISVDTYNKLSSNIQELLSDATEGVETVYRDGIISSTVTDNTLPLKDKQNQRRINSEPDGKMFLVAHGNNHVKDTNYYNIMSILNKTIFEIVKEYLNAENFRLFKDNKEYNPYDNSKNDSTASNYKIKRKIKNSADMEGEVGITLLGEPISTVDQLKAALKIETNSKTKEYSLYSNEGQIDL